MMLVACAAVVFWRRLTHLPYRWFWIGAALWTLAVAIKFAIAIPTNGPIFKFLESALTYPLNLFAGGLFGGLESSLTEIGLTWLAVKKWPQIGQNAERAIGIGVGAGAFEAFLLGLLAAMAVIAALAGVEKTEIVREQVDAVAKRDSLFWLLGTAERTIAILCHTSTRALVLLGVVHKRAWMVFWGFAIFTILDGTVTAAHLTGKLGTFSMWWIELTLLPMALASIPILRWCYVRWSAKSIGAQVTAAAVAE
jgi:hypothetical protein